MKNMTNEIFTTGLLCLNVNGLVTNSARAVEFGVNSAGIQTASNFGSVDPLIFGSVLYTA